MSQPAPYDDGVLTDDEDLHTLTAMLVEEFADSVPADRVWGCVVLCRDRLWSTGLRHGLIAATEAAARVTLLAWTPAQTR